MQVDHITANSFVKKYGPRKSSSLDTNRAHHMSDFYAKINKRLNKSSMMSLVTFTNFSSIDTLTGNFEEVGYYITVI